MAKQEKNQQAQTEHSQAGAVIEMLTERGYLGNQEINDAKLRDARQEKQKAAYHNTLMLLKQYRNIAWMLECFPDTKNWQIPSSPAITSSMACPTMRICSTCPSLSQSRPKVMRN